MNLIVKPQSVASGVALSLTPEEANWVDIGFSVVKLAAGETYEGLNTGVEAAIVVLGGRLDIQHTHGFWENVGARANVFDGLPYAAYLPLGTRYTLTARTDVELAIATSKADTAFEARLVTPDQVEIEIRGAGNATRQINKILKPEFPAQKLLVVEVFTPSGNWSSYPPHKHDAHAMPHEADLEEIYYYKIDKPEGYAIQKVYTDDRRIDETLTVRDGELVLIPEGYHPVVAPPGYNVYYLNALAGSARSMAASDDPAYAWVRETWEQQARPEVHS